MLAQWTEKFLLFWYFIEKCLQIEKFHDMLGIFEGFTKILKRGSCDILIRHWTLLEWDIWPGQQRPEILKRSVFESDSECARTSRKWAMSVQIHHKQWWIWSTQFLHATHTEEFFHYPVVLSWPFTSEASTNLWAMKRNRIVLKFVGNSKYALKVCHSKYVRENLSANLPSDMQSM